VRVLGFEASERCVDYAAAAVHVVQHLRFHERVYGEFYLAPPKAGSVGTVDLYDQDSAALAEHAFKYPPAPVVLPDITRGTPDPGKEPPKRVAALLFTDR
jgi:hypothetical protein